MRHETVDDDTGLKAWLLFDSQKSSRPAHRVTRDGDTGHIQFACEWTVHLHIQALKFVYHEFQIFEPNRRGEGQRLVIAFQFASEVAAKNRRDKPTARKFDRCRFVSVID